MSNQFPETETRFLSRPLKCVYQNQGSLILPVKQRTEKNLSVVMIMINLNKHIETFVTSKYQYLKQATSIM